jgi:hypothetical protein
LEPELKEEIEKLKMKIVELTNKVNMTISFDEKEEYQKEIELVKKQIVVLEKLKI